MMGFRQKQGQKAYRLFGQSSWPLYEDMDARDKRGHDEAQHCRDPGDRRKLWRR